MGQIVIGSTSLVSSAITTNDQINVKKRLDQMQRIIQDNNIELENTKTLNVELQKEIKQAKEVNSGINSRIINLIKYNNTQVNNLRHKESLINELNNCKNPSDIDRLKSEILDIDNKIKYNSEISLNGLLDIEKESKICVEKGFGIDSIKKTAILDFYLIWTFIESLEIFHRIAFSLLILKSIIISSCISIIFIFYGDYLIQKFNIEKRFPKLAKIIQLRRKFQRYYLLAAISWIFIVSFIEIIFSIYVLSC